MEKDLKKDDKKVLQDEKKYLYRDIKKHKGDVDDFIFCSEEIKRCSER